MNTEVAVIQVPLPTTDGLCECRREGDPLDMTWDQKRPGIFPTRVFNLQVVVNHNFYQFTRFPLTCMSKISF